MSSPAFPPAQREQIVHDLTVLTETAAGPFQVNIRPAAPAGVPGFTLTPVTPALAALHELAHLQLGWWAREDEARAVAGALQDWFDRRAQQPWQAPARQTLHFQTLSIDVRDPLGGYQRRVWSEDQAPAAGVPFWAQIEDSGPVRTLSAVSLRSPAAAQATLARVTPCREGVGLLNPADQLTFGPLLARCLQGHHAHWGEADILVDDGAAPQTLTCAAAAYLSPCLDFGLVTAFGPGGPVAFALPFCDVSNGAGVGGRWQQWSTAELLGFRAQAIVPMSSVTFGAAAQ